MKVNRASMIGLLVASCLTLAAISAAFLFPRPGRAISLAMTKAHANGPGANAPPAGSFPAPTMASFGAVEATFTTAPGRVTIDANFTMWDARIEIPYLWTVTVREPDSEQTPFSLEDKDRAFTIKSSEEVVSTFHETLTLKPGNYLIEVHLFELPQDEGKRDPAWPSTRTPRGLGSDVRFVAIPG